MSRTWMLVLMFGVGGQATGQQVYNMEPDWKSDNPHYSTGAALVDLNRDGWLDLVISDGNDMARGPLNVYYNDGAGTFPTIASWQSDDLAYNGHLDIADVNGDGWLDVAVVLLINEGTVAKVYLNNTGTLSSLPDWTASEDVPAFGIAFGDINGDGRPDLAVATGFVYDTPHHQHHNYAYLNVGGELEPSASWHSDDTHDLQGVLFADADNDGRLDLVGIGARCQTRVYRNLGGSLETTASWETTDSADQDGIMVAVGDVNGDGYRELFATDNTQLGGTGRFKQYTGLPAGFYETTYSWSYYDGYGSVVALADVNADDLLDLATGAWWDRTRMFFNNGAGFDATYSWVSRLASTVERIVFGDIDPACGVELVLTEVFPADGVRWLFHLPHQPIQGLVEVRRDGVLLDPGAYTWSREYAWISVGEAPVDSLHVTYTYSHSMDMIVSNWDLSQGNHLRYNLLIDDCNNNGVADGCDIAAGTSSDDNGNGIPDECESIPGDVDGDGDVDQADLGLLLAAYGACVGDPNWNSDADFDASGCVDQADLGVLLSNYGTD